MGSDAQKLVREGSWIVGGEMGLCILMLGLIALFRDGAAASAIVAQLIGAIEWGMPILGGIITMGQLVQAYIFNRTPNTVIAERERATITTNQKKGNETSDV